ncbi:MAG: rhodanese-like domain-containing protein, partial [Akkermansiaceae bacterium]
MKLLPILSITIALVGISYADTTKPSTKSGAKPSVKANTKPNKKTFKPSQVDYPGFANLTQEVKKYRKSRLVKLDTFNRLASEKNTIILDTRSKWAFQGLHIKGAIHLNFSDFTEE